jgi:hypothetical protein
MDPAMNTTPGLGLPQPSVGMGPAAPVFAQGADIVVPHFQATPPSMPPVAPALPPSGQPQSAVQQIVPSAPMSPTVHEEESQDGDAVDAEWVSKAREVVERTHTDPYLQSKELSKVRAQYIKARYNKEIKVSEET